MKGKQLLDNKFEYTFFDRQIIDDQFERILTTVDRKLPPREINKAIHEILVNQTILVTTFDKSSPGLQLYRITTEYPTFTRDDLNSYSYPPSSDKNGKKCNSGRANIEGNPILYTALDPFTAFKEMEKYLEPEKSFYVSVWEIDFLKPTFAHTLVLNSKNKIRESVLHKIAKPHEEGLKKMIKSLPYKELRHGFIYSVEKMGDLFASEGQEIYPLTSAYANQIMYDGPKSPLIIYPSVLNDQQSVNIAIHPDFVDSESVKMTDVFEVFYSSEELTNESVNIKIKEKGKVEYNGEKSKIIWQIPEVTITRIDFSKLSIETYNQHNFYGVEAANKLVGNKGISVQEFIDKMMNGQIIKNIRCLQENQINSGNMLASKRKHMDMINIELKHHESHSTCIETSFGKSCLKRISIHVEWIEEYK